MNYKDKQRLAGFSEEVGKSLQNIHQWQLVVEERMKAIEEKLEIEDGTKAAVERLMAEHEEAKSEETSNDLVEAAEKLKNA